MWKSASWIERLNLLPELNLDEKARARVIILSKPREDRALYFEGTYTEAAATIRALLRETPVVALEASAPNLVSSDASGGSHASCCTTTTTTTTTTITSDNITTSRSGATATTAASSNPSTASSNPSSTSTSNPSSTSAFTSTSASTSPTPLPREGLLMSTASSIRNLVDLAPAFRAAHFWASQPGDVYCRTVRKQITVYIAGGGNDGDGKRDGGGLTTTVMYERGETRFARVVSASPPSKDGSSPGAVIAIRIRAAEARRLWSRPPLPAFHNDGGGAAAAAVARSQQPPDVAAAATMEEFESEVVPDPRDSLEALTARLERQEVVAAEVLWSRRGPGKWALWVGSPQRAWCVVKSVSQSGRGAVRNAAPSLPISHSAAASAHAVPK